MRPSNEIYFTINVRYAFEKNRENGKAQDYDLSAANRHQLLKRKSGTFFVRLVSYLKSRLEFKWALKITAVFENMPIQANCKTS